MHDHPLGALVQKLAARSPLDDEDRASITALPYLSRTYEAPGYVLREGEPPRRHCSLIQSGYAFRQKITANGTRQIVYLHMPGDFLDLQQLFLMKADHSVQALTRLETVEIERSALKDLILARPAIGAAMWIDALVEASILREWILNVGRRDARARVAHLLCEFALRMKAAGVTTEQGYELPMTQEQIADAVGLTPVHINRTLKSLTGDGLVHRNKRYLQFEDWSSISRIGDFSALYLHLDQISQA